jgi:CubicO group peptidase (beta-lactamase class C family)
MLEGLTPSGLARMRRVLAGHVERGTAPGLVALVSRHGRTHVEAIGHTTVDGTDAMRADSLFRLASVTKPMTAVGGLTLVEDCVLRLDDPVDELLPELADRRVLRRPDAPLTDTVPADRPITVRDVLTFRLGLGLVMAAPGTRPIQDALLERGIGGGPPRPTDLPTPDEWLRRLGELPLVHQPGRGWAYNLGSDLLGVLIERATGRRLGEVLAERVFGPVGMVDTGFSVPDAALPRLVGSYVTDPVDGALAEFDPAHGTAWGPDPVFHSGAAGLVSTAADVALFGRMLLDGGRCAGGRVLSRTTVEAMVSDGLSAELKAACDPAIWSWDHRGWGIGLAVATRREPGRPGGFGWDGGLGTSWWSDPAEDLTGVLLTQAGWTSPAPPAVCRDFWTCVYAALDD